MFFDVFSILTSFTTRFANVFVAFFTTTKFLSSFTSNFSRFRFLRKFVTSFSIKICLKNAINKRENFFYSLIHFIFIIFYFIRIDEKNEIIYVINSFFNLNN